MDTINVSKRDFSVKAKKLRREGIVPGSVFGGHLPEAISLQIGETELRKLLMHNRVGSRLNLNLDGKIIPVQLKEKSTDPISGAVNEISFQALAADHKVNSVIDIILKNVDKITTAVVQIVNTSIPYDALPADMIDTITIDVDGMPVGTTVTVADIPELQTGKLELKVPADELIFRIAEKKAEAEEEEAPAAEAAE